MAKLIRIPSMWSYKEFKQIIAEDIAWYLENNLYDPEDPDLEDISFMQFIWLEQYDTFVVEGGLTRLYLYLLSLLYEIETDNVDERDAHFAYLDLHDFLEGGFDDVIPKDELKEIKADAKKVYDYIVEHELQ